MTTGRALLRTAALVAGAAALSAPAAGAASPARVALRGTVSPAVAQGWAHAIGAAPASAHVQAVVSFKPRNRVLLDWMAAHSSGRPGLSDARIRQLFVPRPATVAAVRGYLAANGLTVADSSDMSLVVDGTVAAAQRAFGTRIDMYLDPRGRVYHAPAGNVALPPAIASVVQSVDGLDSSLRAQPHYKVARHAHAAPPHTVPAAVGPACAGAQSAQNTQGGYLPDDLAAAYNYDGLLAGNNDGSGLTIGLVEFSSYHRSDVTSFKSCFPGGITGTAGADVPVGSPTSDLSGQVEVSLDFDVAMGAAPDATWTAYKAANNLALGPTVWNKMRTDGVNIISDSWGLCELLVPPKLTSVENVALEAAAVAGISVYVASGDSGSAECYPVNQQPLAFDADDPAGQPYATGVGGTKLLTAPLAGGRSETGWRGSGGGISINWPKPFYQKGGRTPNVPGAPCLGGTSQCRMIPDIALDATPTTGYVVFSHGISGRSGTWGVVGGTSGAAPLMAGITADADESAPGHPLGFANPFLYAEPSTSFHDILSGNNCLTGCPSYTAKAGFDMVTGLGSPQAGALAADLAAYTATPPTFDTSLLTAGHPLAGAKVRKGTRVTFRGILKDTTTHTGIANAQILLIDSRSHIFGVDRTDSTGAWTFTTPVSATKTWHATYMGSDLHQPSITPSRTIFAT